MATQPNGRPVASNGETELPAGTVVAPSSLSSTEGWAVSYPVHLPSGYQTPSGIAATGSALWLFANGGTPQAPLNTAFEWSNGQLQSYQLDSSNPALQAASDTPIVVDPSGTAWIGVNRTLVSVNPTSGAIDSFTLPDVTMTSSGTGLPVPPSTTSAEIYTDIDAIALGANGDIVIGRMYAAELQLLDPASGGISVIPLPSGTELAGLGSGDLLACNNGL
jgi:streptogramin lyase